MPHLPFSLSHAVDREQRSGERFLPILFQQTGPEDDVELPRPVLERREQRAVRRAGPLPNRDQSAHARAGRCAVRISADFVRGHATSRFRSDADTPCAAGVRGLYRMAASASDRKR